MRNEPSDFKYRIFLLGGGALALAQVVLKYSTAKGDIIWDTHIENLLAAILMAWIAERYAQRKLKIHLRWLGAGARHIRVFLVSVLCWALFVWIAIPGIFESNSLSRFFTNVAVVYLFAGAFFETCNLIKVRAEKTKPV